jgi:hypothetical protein
MVQGKKDLFLLEDWGLKSFQWCKIPAMEGLEGNHSDWTVRAL